MPELPEVETVVRDLRKKIIGRKIIKIWTDFPKMIKLPQGFGKFKRQIEGRTIKKVWRKGKNILFNLSGEKILLIHQKLTGHLLFGKWIFQSGRWRPAVSGPLADDPMNRFLHLIFFLDNGQMLSLCDVRKFAKVELGSRRKILGSKELKELGDNPVSKEFTFNKFRKVISKRRKGRIKSVLMDQRIIAGIGNIYSNESLWEAKVDPRKEVTELGGRELKRIYNAIKKILQKAIALKGESISDFRRISGEKGGFDPLRKVYRREGKPCLRCGAPIKRIVINGRSTYFCPKCQK